jgi:hypothetical protein
MTEQVDVAVTLQTCSREVFVSNHGRSTDCGFPQSLQANYGILQQLGHERFLPNPFQSIVY